MKDIRQIKLISAALTKEKDKYLHELAKVTASIEKKFAVITKMVTYQKEYSNSESLQLSRSVPALNKNLYSFSRKIDDVIRQAEAEVVNLKKIKASMLQAIDKIDNKIKLMSLFENRAKLEAQSKADKREQVMLDDLSATKFMRGDHD